MMRTRSRGKKVSATGIVLYIVVVHTAASVSFTSTAKFKNSLKATTKTNLFDGYYTRWR